MKTFTVPEKLSFVAPLGICFHDVATGEIVNDGLRVMSYPLIQTKWIKKSELLPNRRGIYVLQQAWGLEDFSRGIGDFEYWESRQKTFIVEVSDAENRFQSFSLKVNLPIKGIYKWESGVVSSPSQTSQSVPLYSSTKRKLPGGMSVIRAELRQNDESPAKFAVVEAFFEGNLIARGLSDNEGKIALIFPEPAPQSNPIASPPAVATKIPLSDQKWEISFAVKYQPSVFLNQSPVIIQETNELFPNLEDVLEQESGKLWKDFEQTQEFQTAILQPNTELILRSQKPKISPPLPENNLVSSSFLYISPAL